MSATRLQRLRQKLESRHLAASNDVVGLIEIAEAAMALSDEHWFHPTNIKVFADLANALDRFEGRPERYRM